MTAPPLSAKASDPHLEQVVRLIRERRATTRPALVQVSGLSRKIVVQRVDQLVAMGLVREGPTAVSTGGRPAVGLEFATDAGCVLAVELGATGMTAALADLSGQVLSSRNRRLPFGAAPGVALGRAKELFTKLLDGSSGRGPLRGIGVGVLGPVSPRGLTMELTPGGGWDAFSVAEWFGERYHVPVWVDNEVNLMAVGEAQRRQGEQGRNLLYVKVSSGVGAGLISDGRLYRGTSGVAGELGHMTISADRSLVCWCGNSGCLVTLASGRAIAKFGVAAMRKGQSPFLAGMPARQIRDEHVVAGAHAGDEACLAILNRAGEALGLAVAGATNLINPALIVIGGRVGGATRDLLTEPVRRAVEAHAFPLATESIVIESSASAYMAGVSGAALMVVEGLLTGSHLAAWQGDLEEESDIEVG
ncbi:MAG TPA: ROK family protein [Dermatophilaceae bacterium]|nr:ROK family protein [Dermatophilaceae bacterium]